MDLCGDMLLAHLPRGGRSPWRPPAFARRFAGSPPGCRPSAGETPRSTPTGCSTGSSTSPAMPGGLPVNSICSTSPIIPTRNSPTSCRPIGSASTATTSTRSAACWTRLANLGRGGTVSSPAASCPGCKKPRSCFTARMWSESRSIGPDWCTPTGWSARPDGVASEFTADSPRTPIPLSLPLPWLAELGGQLWVLHVGTCIPRKRIDVLLDVCAKVRKTFPDLRLVKVSGEWTAAQRDRIDRLGLAGAITHVGGLARAELAEVYRRATVVLMPSEAEGFGLPVIEALACGAAVVASDIPALREAGGPAAVYAPVGDVGAWSAAVAKLLADPGLRALACGAASVGGAVLVGGPRRDHRPGIPPALVGFVRDASHLPCESPF